MLEGIGMKGGEDESCSVWQSSVKVLSIIGLGTSAALILSGCGDPATFALQPLANEPTRITIEDTGEEAVSYTHLTLPTIYSV